MAKPNVGSAEFTTLPDLNGAIVTPGKQYGRSTVGGRAMLGRSDDVLIRLNPSFR